jgi:RNA recognition motif-containing protein
MDIGETPAPKEHNASTSMSSRRVCVCAQSNLDSTLFVGPVPQGVTTDDLRRDFACLGEIYDVRWLRDHCTRRFKDHAFVHFYDEASVRDALYRLGGAAPYPGCQVHEQLGRPVQRRYDPPPVEQHQYVQQADTVSNMPADWYTNLLLLAAGGYPPPLNIDPSYLYQQQQQQQPLYNTDPMVQNAGLVAYEQPQTTIGSIISNYDWSQPLM